jgi:hypothetical protein
VRRVNPSCASPVDPPVAGEVHTQHGRIGRVGDGERTASHAVGARGGRARFTAAIRSSRLNGLVIDPTAPERAACSSTFGSALKMMIGAVAFGIARNARTKVAPSMAGMRKSSRMSPDGRSATSLSASTGSVQQVTS